MLCAELKWFIWNPTCVQIPSVLVATTLNQGNKHTDGPLPSWSGFLLWKHPCTYHFYPLQLGCELIPWALGAETNRLKSHTSCTGWTEVLCEQLYKWFCFLHKQASYCKWAPHLCLVTYTVDLASSKPWHFSVIQCGWKATFMFLVSGSYFCMGT